MSPIAAGLDALLALLLMLALGLGMKLNTRLKTLREGQAGFAAAVIELNQAAARAEAGLTALKTASESAHDDLLARIETARSLVTRLERAGADVHRTLDALPDAAPPPLRASALGGSSGVGGSLAAIAALAEGRFVERAGPASEPGGATPSAPRRATRPAFDEDLFETKSRDPVPRERAPRDRASSDLGDLHKADLGPLRPSRGAL